MNREGLFISERLNEVTRMCDREHPIYEQISNFSVALYVLGHLKCSDLLFADDVDEIEAAAILKEHFVKIDKKNIPADYNICESHEKYLLVIGDPLLPVHFAVVSYMQRERPYFSKIKFYGSGFDSLAELESEFLGKDGIGFDDVSYYRLKTSASRKKNFFEKIYTFKDDGNYSVLEYQSEIN
jgi:hypothetical protein